MTPSTITKTFQSFSRSQNGPTVLSILTHYVTYPLKGLVGELCRVILLVKGTKQERGYKMGKDACMLEISLLVWIFVWNY